MGAIVWMENAEHPRIFYKHIKSLWIENEMFLILVDASQQNKRNIVNKKSMFSLDVAHSGHWNKNKC